jgi:hypothetical protein
MREDSRMPTPLDPATLPRNVTALRTLLLHREDEHAAALEQQAIDLQTALNGLKEQVLRNEQLKLRLAKLLRERFGASSEKLRVEIEQLELVLGELEEQVAQATPPEAEKPVATDTETPRRKPVRKPLPEALPRDVVEYVPGSFRVTRHVRPKLSCRGCEAIAQAPAPSLPIRLTAWQGISPLCGLIYRGVPGMALILEVQVLYGPASRNR